MVYPAQIRTPLDHYLGPRRPHLLFPGRWGLLGDGEEGEPNLDAALREPAADDRIWLVTWWLPAEPARNALAAHADLLEAREFPGNVRVELYRLR